MKKLILLLACMMSLTSYAQSEVVVKAGTMVPLQNVNTTRATDVKVGDKMLFRVARDINVNGKTAIPYGTMVKGTVDQAKRSSWWGTKGRLRVNMTDICLPNGDIVPLDNCTAYVCGKNRTALSVSLFLFVVWPACFICGSKAEMQAGYEVVANVAANTTVKVD